MSETMRAETKKATKKAGDGSLRMVASMGTVGLFASVLLVATYRLTTPYVEANRAAYLEAAIFEVLPGAAQKATFTRDGETLVPLPDGAAPGFRLYTGYDAAGALTGVAVEAQGQGFADVIRILYGYAPSCRCVVGMKVLESKETPGLGDKIYKDEAFRANFDRLDVGLGADGTTLLHPPELVKNGQKTEAWQIEAITGATVSSKAITEIIRQSTAAVVPLIEKNLATLQRTP